MIFFSILLFLSFAAIAVMATRGRLPIRFSSKEEISSRVESMRPFWNDLHDLFVVPTVRVHQEKVLPITYKEIEKLVRRFRIIVLRIECLLMRLTEYIRGKRTLPANGHKSHYWETLNNCKNGTLNQDDVETDEKI